MQYRNLGVMALVGNAIAATVPSSAWTTLTPSATLAGATSEYTGSFGIAVNPISTAAAASSVAGKNVRKADATQIGDGQIQATTGTDSTTYITKTTAQAVTQIGDGQIQATTSTKATAQAVTQIGDGQVQATTATKATVQAVTQIGDGQVQATTAATKATAQAVTQIGDGQVQATTATKATAQAVTQIGDGQIQATTSTKATAQAVTQIGDGQVQATTSTKAGAQAVTQIGDGQIQATTSTKATAEAATQIGDGQVQATTSTKATTGAATQIGDGQVQATSATISSTSEDSASTSSADSGIKFEACSTNSTLAMELHDGVLTDAKGRIGSIVANSQFQFDGPPPQAGAIYAGGWSISEDGLLAIGANTTFYQCLSGNFYNLYNQEIGSECYPVELEIVELINC
ncbi:hypothetical protein C6P42_003198 [Pichia californica]|nr:hypothetical protein C6P42_003198 [[Candida] californica]